MEARQIFRFCHSYCDMQCVYLSLEFCLVFTFHVSSLWNVNRIYRSKYIKIFLFFFHAYGLILLFFSMLMVSNMNIMYGPKNLL